jgi:hypothetical protein
VVATLLLLAVPMIRINILVALCCGQAEMAANVCGRH